MRTARWRGNWSTGVYRVFQSSIARGCVLHEYWCLMEGGVRRSFSPLSLEDAYCTSVHHRVSRMQAQIVNDRVCCAKHVYCTLLFAIRKSFHPFNIRVICEAKTPSATPRAFPVFTVSTRGVHKSRFLSCWTCSQIGSVLQAKSVFRHSTGACRHKS
jgi:hypothetical protein